MQKLKLLIPLALFLGAFFVACHEEDPFESDKIAHVAFAGRIVDEQGDPISGALVKAGAESAITDLNGVFRLEEVSLAANHAIVSVTKAGFFDFSRAYVVQDHALLPVTIQLLAEDIAGTLNAASGGLVNVAGGPKITFPSNAFADENGNPYNGTVQVIAKFIDPKSPSLGLQMPGDLTGLNLAGQRQALSTYGMIGVELRGTSGQKLNLAANKEAEIRVPIDASIVSGAPAEIPLWHYDLQKAYWIEEGVAQKIGNEYVGKVKHFSFWNYDGNLPSIIVSGSVYLNDTNHPLAGVNVSISPANPSNGWGCGHGTTDVNGFFGGNITKDEVLNVVITWWDANCGNNPLYQAQIGPFSTDVTLPPIILSLPAAQTITVSGKLVDCNAQPVANGYAKIALGSSTNFAFADMDGKFESISIDCGAPASGQVTGYDLTNLLESTPVSFSLPPNTFDVGSIQVCSAVTEFIQYTLDGQPETIVDPSGWISADTFPSNSFYTSLNAISANQQTGISIGFSSPQIQTGTYPLIQFFVSPFEVDMSQSNLNTTVTATGNIGDLIIGTFGGTFQDMNGGNHTVSGSYRVVRDW